MKRLILIICVVASFSSLAQNFPLGTTTAIWGRPTAEQMRYAKDNGVEYIEIALNSYYRNTHKDKVALLLDSLKNNIDSSQICVWSFHLPFSKELDLSVSDEVQRRKNIEVISQFIEQTLAFNPKCYVIHPSSEPIEPKERELRKANTIKSLQEIQKLIKGKGVTLCVENLPRTCLGNTPEELLEIVQEVNGAKICFDTNHYIDNNHDKFVSISHFLEIAGDKIATIHASDYDFENECHWLPSNGLIDWTEFIKELKNCNYKGVFMYEAIKLNATDKGKLTVDDIVNSYRKITKSN